MVSSLQPGTCMVWLNCVFKVAERLSAAEFSGDAAPDSAATTIPFGVSLVEARRYICSLQELLINDGSRIMITSYFELVFIRKSSGGIEAIKKRSWFIGSI